MHDAVVWKIASKCRTAQYKLKLNLTLLIIQNSSVELKDVNAKVAGSSPLSHYFSSNNVCLLAYVFTAENQQLEWLKHEESNSILVRDKGFIFRIFPSCLNLQGPTFTIAITFEP